MNYFYWRQHIPIYLILFYIISKLIKFDISKISGYIIIFTASIFIIYSYPVNIWVSIEWAIYMIISYWYSLKKRNELFALTYSILSATFGGWIYEIPYFHPTFMFYDLSCPLYLHSQIISGIFMIGMLIKEKMKINKYIIIAFIVFVISEIFFYIRVNYYKQLYFDLFLFSRLGIMFLLLSFLNGLNECKNND